MRKPDLRRSPGRQSEMFPNADVSALRSIARRDSNCGSLFGPTRRHVHQTRNTETARKSSLDCRLDDVRCKESKGKSHAGRSFTDAFAGGDRLNAFDLAGDHFV